MRKDELVAAMAAESGLTKRAAEDALDAFITTIDRALHAGERVKLSGFGVFELKHRAPRVGRKTVDGRSVEYPIDARDVPVFKPTKAFKETFI